ncbi:hypothetical protein IMSAGC021_00159 [Muribaculaceae bacterium]|nr:hypothetical protein IMSAGC021_00159 [Muribaculaceae bacterium]
MADGQWLYHVGHTVFFMEVFQNAFIDGSADGETECGVEAIAHVGEVLMAQKLDQHCGHFGVHHLAIRLVTQFAAGPCRLVEGLDVTDNLVGDHVGIAARGGAGLATTQTRAFGVDNRHRAHSLSGIRCGAGVGMECKREVNGNSEAFLSRKLR